MKAEIQDGNRLIAEYMNELNEWFYYNRSWDCLMPVVEKINEQGNNVKIFNKGCQINAGEIDVRDKDSLIECVWYAVVKFIQKQSEKI